MDFARRDVIHRSPLVSTRVAFEQYDEAYQFIASHRETAMKVLIDLDQKG